MSLGNKSCIDIFFSFAFLKPSAKRQVFNQEGIVQENYVSLFLVSNKLQNK